MENWYGGWYMNANFAPPDEWVRREGTVLLVLLPGVNQSRYTWRLRQEYFEQNTRCAIYAPLLVASQDSTLDLTDVVVREISEWKASHPGLVVVVGYSNGGRIACAVAERIEVDKVITVGSPLSAPKTFEYVARWLPRWLASMIGHIYIGPVYHELMLQQECGRALFQKMETVRYTHFASTKDWMVWPAERAAFDRNPIMIEAGNHRSLMHHPDVRVRIIQEVEETASRSRELVNEWVRSMVAQSISTGCASSE